MRGLAMTSQPLEECVALEFCCVSNYKARTKAQVKTHSLSNRQPVPARNGSFPQPQYNVTSNDIWGALIERVSRVILVQLDYRMHGGCAIGRRTIREDIKIPNKG